MQTPITTALHLDITLSSPIRAEAMRFREIAYTDAISCGRSGRSGSGDIGLCTWLVL